MKNTRLFDRDVFRASESSVDDDGVEWITILREGTSENNRRYSRSVLERAVESKVYDGSKMFVDHSDGPPLKRSMRELVSAIGETKLDTSFPDGKARIRGALEWLDEEFHGFAQRAQKHIGVSHDALLRGTRSMKNGRRFEDISEIKKSNSVDWVVWPSAGGGFEPSFLVKEGVEMTDAIDWDAIDEDMLKEKAPDLYKTLTTRAKEEVQNPPPPDGGDDGDGDEGEPEGNPAPQPLLERQIESIVVRAMENVNEKQKQKQISHDQVKAAVNASTLPPLTKERVINSFAGSESFEEKRVTEAIDSAKQEIAAIAGPRVRDMGLSGNGSSSSHDLGRAHESLVAAFGVDPLKTTKEE
jgi:hypothetical protein